MPSTSIFSDDFSIYINDCGKLILGKVSYKKCPYFYRFLDRGRFGARNEVTPTQSEAVLQFLSEMEPWFGMEDAQQISIIATWQAYNGRIPELDDKLENFPVSVHCFRKVSFRLNPWLYDPYREVCRMRYLKRQRDKYPPAKEDQYVETKDPIFDRTKRTLNKLEAYKEWLTFYVPTYKKDSEINENLLYSVISNLPLVKKRSE